MKKFFVSLLGVSGLKRSKPRYIYTYDKVHPPGFALQTRGTV